MLTIDIDRYRRTADNLYCFDEKTHKYLNKEFKKMMRLGDPGASSFYFTSTELQNLLAELEITEFECRIGVNKELFLAPPKSKIEEFSLRGAL